MSRVREQCAWKNPYICIILGVICVYVLDSLSLVLSTHSLFALFLLLDSCKDKCERCLKDWKWKWVVIFLVVIGLMVLAVFLLTEEHTRIDDEINARTYRLNDVDSCKVNPLIAKEQSPDLLSILLIH